MNKEPHWSDIDITILLAMLVTRDRPKRKVERLLLRETKGGKRKVSGGDGRGKERNNRKLDFLPPPLLESMFDLPLRGKEGGESLAERERELEAPSRCSRT